MSDKPAGKPPVAIDKKPIPEKKPYSPPVLHEWGSLRDLTKAIGWSGNDDGGKGKQPRRTR